jgi:hypothetical protein
MLWYIVLYLNSGSSIKTNAFYESKSNILIPQFFRCVSSFISIGEETMDAIIKAPIRKVCTHLFFENPNIMNESNHIYFLFFHLSNERHLAHHLLVEFNVMINLLNIIIILKNIEKFRKSFPSLGANFFHRCW